MDYFHQIGSGPLFAAAELESKPVDPNNFEIGPGLHVNVSTKACPKCGDTKLVRLTSQNLKICSKCKTEIVWRLDDNQKSIY